MKRTLTLVCLFLFTSSFAQTLVNQSIADTMGQPSVIYQYTKALPVPGTDNVVVLANTYNPGYGPDNDDFFLYYVSKDSGFINGAGYTSAHGGIDFGTNVYVKGPYAYMVGFTTDSVLSRSILCNTFKVNLATFDTAWTISQSIDSAASQQAPFSILVDDSGAVYVGASVQTPTDYKIAIIKYDSTGHEMWESSWDTAGLYSLPVAMAFSAGYVNVTGFSFDSLGHSDFLTLPVNMHTGSQLTPKFTANGTGTVSHPVGIIADSSGHSYIAGTSTVAGTTSVIKVVGYDQYYSQLWESTYGDSTQTNTAAAMSMNNVVTGLISVTGTVPNSSGGSSMVTLRYNTDGSLAWAAVLNAPNPANAASGVSVTNDQSGNTYATGTVSNGVDTNIITAAYDTGGHLLWSKIFSRTPSSNDVPYGITMGGDGVTVYVTARSYATDSLYIMLEYDEYTKTNTIATTATGGQYVADQIIIRFDPSMISQDAVNNLDVNFGPPSYWLTATADSALQANVPFDLSTCTMERIYKGLKTTYKYSTARNGDLIPLPNLWAALLLIYPDQGKSEEVSVAQGINAMYPMVTNTNLNYVGQPMSECYDADPHPAGCRINDYYFGYNSGATPQQPSLWSDSAVTCMAPYNINADSAWQLETGKPFVRVGIYDSQLYGLHQDFSPNPNPSGPWQPGSKVNGWDFYNNVSLSSENWYNGDPHGTAVAGIVGAIRNNNRGIAGMAGGSYADTTDVGVTLYGMTIMSQPLDEVTLPMADLCNALVQGSSFVSDSAYGYGLHVINNSWGIAAVDYTSSIASYSELELAFKTVYKNQTAIIAAAGNTATTFQFPANFYNDWIICTGGANDAGGWFNSGTMSYTASAVSPCIDVIAPGGDRYESITTLTATSPIDYTASFAGTSIAAPHVTGTVALLMSYLDSTASLYQNLSPEDAEHLIIRTADNQGYIGHSDSSGWGALNAGRALQGVNKGCKQLVHLGKGNNLNVSGTFLKAYVPITLTEQYTNPLTGQTFDTIPYLCWVYEETNTMSQSLDSNFVITDYWARPSSTTLMLAYDSVSGTLQPFEHLYINSMSATSATVSGYYYLVYSTIDSSFLGYWGVDSAVLTNVDSFRFDYTLLLTNPTVSCNPLDTTTSIKKLENQMNVSFYPNPVEDEGVLQIFTDADTKATIDMIDQQGRTIEKVYTGDIFNGKNTFDIDTKSLTSGIYMIIINSGEGNKTIKFTKL